MGRSLAGDAWVRERMHWPTVTGLLTEAATIDRVAAPAPLTACTADILMLFQSFSTLMREVVDGVE